MNDSTSNTPQLPCEKPTHGFIRLIRSSKAYAALTGSVLAILPVAFAWAGMDSPTHAVAAQALATKLMALWGTVIVMTGVEDAATNATAQASPVFQNNTAGGNQTVDQPQGGPTQQASAAKSNNPYP